MSQAMKLSLAKPAKEVSHMKFICPPRLKSFGLRRMTFEYASSIKNLSAIDISNYLLEELEWRLKERKDLIPCLEGIGDQLIRVGKGLETQYNQFRDNISCDQDRDRINAQLLNLINADKADQLLAQQIEISLLRRVRLNQEEDPLSYFEIAWLNIFYLNNYLKAEQYLEACIQFSTHAEFKLTQLAKRHLAYVYYLQKEYEIAASTQLDVLNAELYPEPEYQYEYARYLAISGDADLAKVYLEQAIDKFPFYLLLIQLEPDFIAIKDMSAFLSRYRNETLQHIWKQTKEKWGECRLADVDLPEELNSEQVFFNTLKRQQRYIQEQPFILVKKNEKVLANSVIRQVKTDIIHHLQSEEHACQQQIEEKKMKWQGVNKVGGMLLHAAAVLLLAVLFVLMMKFIIIAVGLGNTFRFDEAIGQFFILVVVLASVGSYLFQSKPLGTKRLFKRSYAFKNAITNVEQVVGE